LCRGHGFSFSRPEASRHGKRLAAICRQGGHEIRQVKDPRFGLVNVYPEAVLRDYFGQAQE
jgi:hypothetical protein